MNEIKRLVLMAKTVEDNLPNHLKLRLAAKRLQKLAELKSKDINIKGDNSEDKAKSSSKQKKDESKKPRPVSYGSFSKQAILRLAGFDESKHPRKGDGKFAPKGQGESPKSEGEKEGKPNKREQLRKRVKNESRKEVQKEKGDQTINEYDRVSNLTSGKIEGSIKDIDERTHDGSIRITTEDGAEYSLYENEYDAREAARESLRNLYDDLGPEGWNKDFVERHMDISETDKELLADDLTENELDGFEGSDEEREQQHDEIYNRHLEGLNNDPRDYLVNDLGIYSDEDYNKANFVQVDVDALIEESIDIDGISHTLASYDGEEIELENGAVMYRTN